MGIVYMERLKLGDFVGPALPVFRAYVVLGALSFVIRCHVIPFRIVLIIVVFVLVYYFVLGLQILL